jgi:hypothetical protein
MQLVFWQGFPASYSLVMRDLNIKGCSRRAPFISYLLIRFLAAQPSFGFRFSFHIFQVTAFFSTSAAFFLGGINDFEVFSATSSRDLPYLVTPIHVGGSFVAQLNGFFR